MRRLALVAAALTALIVAGAAGATHPGRNGRLVFASERGGSAFGIFTVNANGSGVRRLTRHPPFGVDPAYSPDGRLVAFDQLSASFTHELWIARADGTRPRRLVAGLRSSSPLEPAWSPDGRRLAVVRISGRGRGDLWTVGSGGRGLRRLTATPSSESEPAWSPDGRRLAFVRALGGARAGIYVMPASGGPARRVSFGGAPAWSPDGRRLALVHQNCDVCHYRLYVVGADGRGLRRVTSAADRDDLDPAWSPDGRLIAYAACCDEAGPKIGGTIYVIRPDGRDQRRLFFGEEDAEHPPWSPDGGRIAFDYGDRYLWRVESDGTGARSFFSPLPAADGSPVWSPRGRKLAFVRDSLVYVMDTDGGGRRRICFCWGPTWAPDGNRIAVETEADGIDIVDLATGKFTPILEDEGAGDTGKFAPAWSPDGRTIAYIDGSPEEGAVSLYTVASGDTRALSATASGTPAWSPDGRRLLYTWLSRSFVLDLASGRSRLVARRASSGVFSPDGTRIAFVRSVRGDDEIFTMRADGRNVRRVTRNPGPDVQPDWQPLPR